MFSSLTGVSIIPSEPPVKITYHKPDEEKQSSNQYISNPIPPIITSDIRFPSMHSKQSSLRKRKKNDDYKQSQPQKDLTLDADYQSTEESTESDNDQSSTPHLPIKTKATLFQKFQKRFISTIIMIFVFAVILRIGHTALCIFIAILQLLAFREIARLGQRQRIERQLPGFYFIHVLFLIASIFFLYGHLLFDHFLISIFGLKSSFKFILRHHGLISFSLFTFGVITFVLSLKPKFYKYQFKQLGWCIAIILVVIVQSSFVMKSIMDGIIWLLIPGISIVTNDIMAYVCGVTLGRRFIKRSLIGLSKNKTWEGAIGATFFTFFIVFFVSSFLIKFKFFVCPKHGFSIDFQPLDCVPDDIFIPSVHSYVMPDMLISVLCLVFGGVQNDGQWHVEFADFQLHAMVFALFASIIGPFGGFFASGFKRAFKVKDFSSSIPGHGGIVDRLDCQIMMSLFVYVYKLSFVHAGGNVMSVDEIIAICLNMSLDDQNLLIRTLQKSILQNV